VISFLTPLFLAGAFAAAIPVVLHLLKREPEVRVQFSAVHLLKHAPVEHASRRRLRELLLLALRVAALLLLAFAFARPFFTSGVNGTGATTVVALDGSSSLSAPGRFERAQQLAREAIDRAPAGDLVAVVTFSDAAQVASQPSADRGAARAAVDAARVGAGATSYRAALSAARDLLRGRAGTIVVVTDLQETGWDAGDRAPIPESARIEIADVGAPPPNVAVTAVRVSGERLLATVRNAGPDPADVRVRLDVQDGSDSGRPPRAAAETTVPVGAGQSASVGFPVPAGRWASVNVVDAVGASADNARYVVLDNTARAQVLIITTAGDLSREAFYLQQALVASGADGRAYDAAGVAASDLASWDQARLDRHAGVVLLSTRGLEHHGRQILTTYLTNGGGLLVATGPEVDGDVIEEVLAGPKFGLVAADGQSPRDRIVRSWGAADVRHPVVRAFGTESGALALVQFHRISTTKPQGCQVLARFTTGEAALIDCASGRGHALVLASDLDNRGNDLPLHATFVPFVHESIRYLSGGQRRTSEYFVADVPAGVPPVPGVAAVGSGPGAGLVAINVDPSETDPGRLTPDEFQTAVSRMSDAGPAAAVAQAREQEERQHIWQYVLAAMIVMLAMESFVAARIA
jgi:hypothetical protein